MTANTDSTDDKKHICFNWFLRSIILIVCIFLHSTLAVRSIKGVAIIDGGLNITVVQFNIIVFTCTIILVIKQQTAQFYCSLAPHTHLASFRLLSDILYLVWEIEYPQILEQENQIILNINPHPLRNNCSSFSALASGALGVIIDRYNNFYINREYKYLNVKYRHR